MFSNNHFYLIAVICSQTFIIFRFHFISFNGNINLHRIFKAKAIFVGEYYLTHSWGNKGGSYLSQGYLSQSEHINVTGVRTRLLGGRSSILKHIEVLPPSKRCYISGNSPLRFLNETLNRLLKTKSGTEGKTIGNVLHRRSKRLVANRKRVDEEEF